MRAILVATGESPAMPAFREHRPTAMLPLLDRPWVQHVVEYLAARGFDEFDVILSHLPCQVRALLGDGGRWGVTIRTHLAGDAARPFRAIRALAPPPAGEPALLAWADRLPAVEPAGDRPAGDRPVLYRRAGGEPGWTGWAWAPGPALAAIPPDADEAAAGRALADAGAAVVEVGRVLEATSYAGLLAAQDEAIAGRFPGLMVGAREVEPGVWLARNVVLHPTAEVVPPVYVAEDCQVGAGVRLGPSAVVGRGCVLDAKCSVAGSVVFPSSYVGRGLALDGVLVDRNRLIHPGLDAALAVDDDFLLANLAEDRPGRLLAGLLSCSAAAALLALSAPVLLAAGVGLKLSRRGPALVAREVVRLPAPAEPARRRTFRLWSFDADPAGTRGVADLLLRVLPGLFNVARGDLRLVGLPTRTEAEIREIAPRLAGALPAGEGRSHHRGHGDARAHRRPRTFNTAAACYAVSAGFRRDAAILLNYLLRVLDRRLDPGDPTRPDTAAAPSAPSRPHRPAREGVGEPGRDAIATVQRGRN